MLSLMDYQCAEPFAHTAGPRRPGGVLMVGEAWGESEEKFRVPFAGYSGKELFRMLFEVWSDIEPDLIARTLSGMDSDAWLFWRDKWLDEAGITLTNTLAIRPPRNDLKALCKSKKELPSDYSRPHLSQGQYLDVQYLPELVRLRTEITQLSPNVVVALGNTACWATMDATNIGSIRGTVSESKICPNIKVLGTYHPAAVCRLWSYRPVVISDLMKVRRESQFPEIRRPRRNVLVNPTLSDIERFASLPALYYAVDIETKNKQIEMIGLARSRSDAIVVPFVDFSRPGNSYWRDELEEICALELIERMLTSGVPLIFQNGLFDLQHILPLGLRVVNALHDSMLLSHSLFPEMRKGLGFLGSIFSNEPAWKLMRLKGDVEENKRDE